MKRQTSAAQRPANGKRHPKDLPPEPMVDKDASLERLIGIKKKGMGSRTWMKIDQTGIPEVLIAIAPRVRICCATCCTCGAGRHEFVSVSVSVCESVSVSVSISVSEFVLVGFLQMVEADKYAIMRRVSIPARDLRILDPLLSYPSTVLGREKAIVVNLEHIKVGLDFNP